MLRWKRIAVVWLVVVLLAAVGMPSAHAAQSTFAPEDLIVFSGTDDAICILVRMDEAVRGVSDQLSATLIGKTEMQGTQSINGAQIRVTLPQESTGGRLELCVPVSYFNNGMTLRVQGLTDGDGAQVERAVTFERNGYLTDRIEIEYPDPEMTEQIRQNASDAAAQDAIYCVAGDEIRIGVYTDALRDRVQVQTNGVTLTAGENGVFTVAKAGEGTLCVSVAGLVQKTVPLRALPSAQARKTLLLQTMLRNTPSLYAKHFHTVVAWGIVAGPFSVLLVPILYPLAVVAAPVGVAAELLRVLFA